MPPFRLKMKFIEYLRLHRMVTGVSPKWIWEVLATEQSTELKEYLSQSTPWFSDFVQKWMRALNAEYERIYNAATAIYNDAREACRVRSGQRPTPIWAKSVRHTRMSFCVSRIKNFQAYVSRCSMENKSRQLFGNKSGTWFTGIARW